jgi:pyruvate formate lyase activating enzyme
MTLTGGEPLYQPDFALELLGLAKKAHIHTAMETSGQAPYQVLRQAALHLNALLYDLKTLDPAKHLSFTGVEQSRILENLLKLYQDFPDLPITVRTPVVPSFNQDSTSACEIGRFLRKLPRVCFEALPYHSLGQQKYGYLGRPYTLDSQGLSENDLLQFSQLVNQARFSESTVQSSLA